MLEVLQSVRVGEPAARLLRDEIHALWRADMYRHLDAARDLAELLGEDVGELVGRREGKRARKVTTT